MIAELGCEIKDELRVSICVVGRFKNLLDEVESVFGVSDFKR